MVLIPPPGQRPVLPQSGFSSPCADIKLRPGRRKAKSRPPSAFLILHSASPLGVAFQRAFYPLSPVEGEPEHRRQRITLDAPCLYTIIIPMVLSSGKSAAGAGEFGRDFKAGPLSPFPAKSGQESAQKNPASTTRSNEGQSGTNQGQSRLIRDKIRPNQGKTR